jgi:hypothetical protein
VSSNGPDPRAAARGFIALALDMARIDPDRRPSAEMRQWLSDLALTLGAAPPRPPLTNVELVESALRLEELAHRSRSDGTAPPDRVLAGLSD